MELDTNVFDWVGGSYAECDCLLAGPEAGAMEQRRGWKIKVLGRAGSRSSEILYKGGAGGFFALDGKLHDRQEFPYGCKYVLCLNLIYCHTEGL